MRPLVYAASALALLILILGLARVTRHAAGPPGNPVSARQTGVFRDDRLSESSAAAVSRSQPGIIWTLNDSGNDARIFATDSAGTKRWSYLVEHASNTDWEALALGPCGTGTCLFIGDIGDNNAVRDYVTIYRIAEPTVGAGSGDTTVALLDSLVLRYADGPHDAEALVVNQSGDSFILTKGREGVAWMYQIPATQWVAHEPVRARALAQVGIETSFVGGRLITDAALSPEGDQLAVRTYRTVYIFGRTATSRWLPDQPIRSCDIAGLEPQGEGIDWWGRRTLVLTSERGFARAGTIFHPHLLNGPMTMRVRWWWLAPLLLGFVLLLDEPRSAQAAHQAEWLEAGDVKVRAVRAGSGDTTLLLIHGYGETLLTWRAVLDPLALAHRVVAIDVPGFGGSDKPDRPYTLEVQVERLSRFLDRWTKGPVIVVGHSMGGELAAMLALGRPDRIVAAVLLAPAGFGVGLGGLMDSLTDSKAGALGWYLASRSFLLPDHDPDWLGEPVRRARYSLMTDEAYRRSAARVLREFDFRALRHRLQDLKQPTLVIWGKLDPVIPYAYARLVMAELPCAKLVTLDDAIHRPHVERPDTVVAEIRRFAAGPGCA